MNRFIKTAILWIPSILWMGFIFFLSSRSTIGIGQTRTERFLILKSFHVIEYAILAILLFFAYKDFRFSMFTAYLYSLSDEFHQTFVPGRGGKFEDTIIDLIGITIGTIFIKKIMSIELVRKHIPKLLVD